MQQQVSQADVEAAAMSTEDDGSPPLNPEALVAAKLAAMREAEKAEAAAADAQDPDAAAAPDRAPSSSPTAAGGDASPASKAAPPVIVPALDTLVRCAASSS